MSNGNEMPPEVAVAAQGMDDAITHLTFVTAMNAPADERRTAYREAHEALDHFVDVTSAALRRTTAWRTANTLGLIPTTDGGDPS